MDVAFLLDKYFKGAKNVSIDVFDAQTLNAVYKDVVNKMTSHLEIEVSVLQALSYCLYEIMDNVHIHSGKPLGTAMTYYDNTKNTMSILIADDGMGIKASLSENKIYKDLSEADAIRLCLQDKITDGKGMGFGLYTTSRLIDNIGKEFILHSGKHKLIRKDGAESVIENGLWQGTLVYMVSNSFADECIAKLLLDMPLDDLKRHTTFRGLNPLAERSVLVALQRRYSVIKSEQ